MNEILTFRPFENHPVILAFADYLRREAVCSQREIAAFLAPKRRARKVRQVSAASQAVQP